MRKETHKFCCDDMFQAVEGYKIVDYDEVVREYGILHGKNRIKVLCFCPWCGEKFKKELMLELYDVLENKYGIEDPDINNFTNVPDEFKTDEWWRKRGL